MKSHNLFSFLVNKYILITLGALLLTACSGGAIGTPTASAITDTPTPTATLLPSPTPLPTTTPIPISSICFPLTWHSFADLPLLVSWPFNPEADVRHYGLDLAHWNWKDEASSLNEPDQAIMDGKVAGTVTDRPASGNMITIETTYAQLPSALIERLEILPGQSIYHQYAHLADPPDFQIGQPIVCGQFLDRVGLTGATLAAHLHLETRKGLAGFTFTSMAYYTADRTPEETANYETWFMSGQYQAFDPMIILTQGLP